MADELVTMPFSAGPLDPKRDPRKCKAHTSGVHGPKRPCGNWAIKGGTVCPYHGGSAPQVKQAAARRLRAMLDPALAELEAVYMQNEHMPSKLGAILAVANRVLGKVGDNKEKAQKGPVINIGVGFLKGRAQIEVQHVPTPEAEPETFEAELIDDDYSDE